MKLSWRDIITTLLVIGGVALVYAKFYDFSWAVVESWRSAVAVLGGIGVLLFAFNGFESDNHGFMSVIELVLGIAGLGLAVTGMFVTSSTIFYSLAAVLATWWLASIVHHIRHTITDDASTTHMGTMAH